MSAVWEDVKGRKIFKAATLYAAVAWGIIQIADILLPVLRYPEWVMSSMVLVAFSGFPLALIFGWMLDLKNERAVRAKADYSGEIKSSMSSRFVEFSIILAFGGGAAFLYFNSANQSAQANIESFPSVQQLMAPIENQKTIAVLPFASFGNLQEDEFFADGLSEELLNVLARNKNLRVAARTSSFQYKNQNINVKDIARELGVQYILEGSVRRSGELIRVTAQLIKADEDVHVFSSTWDKDTTNIFKVQDEIAQSVLETLEIKLLGKSEQQHDSIGTSDIAAFAEYSRGVAFIRNRSKEDFIQAIVHLNKALTIDVNYAEANAMLAQTYLLQLSYGLIERESAFKLAKLNIEKALKSNPELPEGHAAKGLLLWQIANGFEDSPKEETEKLRQAKFHLNKAIELNPSNAEAYMWYGTILQNEGQMADGSKLYKKSFEIDPQAAVVGYNRGLDLIRVGNYEEAMSVFNIMVRNNPNYANAYQIAGNVSYSVGQLDQAYNMYKKIKELSSGDDSNWLSNANRILIPIGKFELAQQNIDKLNEVSMSEFKEMIPYLQAQLWLATNNSEAFADWVQTFDENTKNWRERFMRGVASYTKKEWQHASEEFEKSLALLKTNNPDMQGELTIGIQLLLAKTWKEQGDRIKSDSYLDTVNLEIDTLAKERGFQSQLLRYMQASHAAISEKPLEALGLLRQAIMEGFVDVWLIEIDPTFELVRQDPTYNAIMREFNARINLMRLNIESEDNKVAAGQ